MTEIFAAVWEESFHGNVRSSIGERIFFNYSARRPALHLLSLQYDAQDSTFEFRAEHPREDEPYG